MEQNLSWKKAYLASALLHVVIAVLFAIGLAEIVAEKEQQTYVVDLATSNFSQGSGHEGGGSAESLFPEPLKAEEVAKRVETVQQMPVPITPSTVAVPSPDAVTIPDAASPAASATDSSAAPSSPSGSVSGTSGGGKSGTGAGLGNGSGDSTGDGQGAGAGAGASQGSGDSTAPGTGTAPFDVAGFRAAVDANKQYPYMAMKRHLEGTTGITTTISASGAITSVVVSSSSGHSELDEAAVAAAYAVGSYPNPTGATKIIDSNVRFYLQ
mgnify:FL=1